jgi:hypothetical protein
MAETLGEVLGKARGDAMYSREWLVKRVRFHLDPSRTADVFLAETEEQIVGHTIVREEHKEEETSLRREARSQPVPSSTRFYSSSIHPFPNRVIVPPGTFS